MVRHNGHFASSIDLMMFLFRLMTDIRHFHNLDVGESGDGRGEYRVS
jgi:hypothetical protein